MFLRIGYHRDLLSFFYGYQPRLLKPIILNCIKNLLWMMQKIPLQVFWLNQDCVAHAAKFVLVDSPMRILKVFIIYATTLDKLTNTLSLWIIPEWITIFIGNTRLDYYIYSSNLVIYQMTQNIFYSKWWIRNNV